MFIFIDASIAATGSSAMISFGFVSSARAIDTRCSSPPENCVMYLSLTTCSDMPTECSVSSISLSASLRDPQMPRRSAVLYR